ncbi:MAG: hypothetical protein HKM87_11520 [Ignavibacteriaceae bacterium]|nr:hypothetical protein [Ignavibacteriaceae bacterium]
MSLATISFWEESYNSYGIPNTVHSYLISVFVNQIIGRGDKIVKIVPLTDGAPNLESQHPFVVRNTTAEKALLKAFKILLEMPALQGMRNHKSIMRNKDKELRLIQN